jgi:hypothetical protein
MMENRDEKLLLLLQLPKLSCPGRRFSPSLQVIAPARTIPRNRSVQAICLFQDISLLLLSSTCAPGPATIFAVPKPYGQLF